MKYTNNLFIQTIVVLSLAIPSRAQTARDIVNKYLDTVSNGDIHNWDKITSMYTESIGFYSHGNFEQRISLTNNDRPNYHKTWWEYPNKTKAELYSDSAFSNLSSVFYFLPTGSIILLPHNPPIKKDPSNVHDEFFSHFVPVHISKLLAKCESLDLLGIKEFVSEKLSCYEIRMMVNNRIYMLYIDTSTYLLDYWNNREDHDLSNMTGFKNYRRANGLLFPMSDFMKKDGVIFYQSDTKKIELNPSINPKIFVYTE